MSIPEDILNDENLTPQLSYSPQNKPEPEEKQLTEVKPAELKLDSEESRKNKLLSSLNSIFSSSPKPKESKSVDKKTNSSEEMKEQQKPTPSSPAKKESKKATPAEPKKAEKKANKEKQPNPQEGEK